MSTMVIDRFLELQVSSETSRYDVMSFLLYLGAEAMVRTFNFAPPFWLVLVEAALRSE
jgi:hypothetical protein